MYLGSSWNRCCLRNLESGLDLYKSEGFYGMPIRPLRDSAEMSMADDMATIHLSLDSRIAGRAAVTNVRAEKRHPWNGFVDIFVTIQGGGRGCGRNRM